VRASFPLHGSGKLKKQWLFNSGEREEYDKQLSRLSRQSRRCKTSRIHYHIETCSLGLQSLRSRAVASQAKPDFKNPSIPLPLKYAGAIELSVVMPCLNEVETLEACIRKAQQALSDAQISGEVVIADNGSTDGSVEIAERLGARVVLVKATGYGSALIGGIEAAAGKYVVMADADDSYDLSHIPRFVQELRAGADLVMGNRFRGGIRPGAMPFLHRYLGNPVLSGIGRLFFKSPFGDFHCGLRAFSKAAYSQMHLHTTGMEFASEMVVKATVLKLRLAEVPTTLAPDGRSRAPHLRTWRDGWRHLRFLLLYSPRWLFLYPGLALMVVGTLLIVWLVGAPRTLGGITFDVHTMVYAAAFILLGFQAIVFAVFTKVFAISEGLLPTDALLEKFLRYITLEVGIAVGALLIAAGLGISLDAISAWGMRHFGPLDYSHSMRLVIPAALFLNLGVQTIFASFFLSVLRMHRR
jgi:glycosyltransferase involved in cell wall biosynthesis